MKKVAFQSVIILLFALVILPGMLLSACGKTVPAETAGPAVSADSVSPAGSEAESEKREETLTDEQALAAIRNYCILANPDLEETAASGEAPVYWEIASSDEQQIVVLFRSYTGALVRYYIDRSSGDTTVTEFVPGITAEEQQTDEHFNVKDFFA